MPPREGLPDSVNDCSCSNALKPVGMLPDNRLPFAENLLPFYGQIHHVTDSRIVSTARIANTMAVQTYIRFVRALTEFGMVPVSRSDVSKRDLYGGTGSSQPTGQRITAWFALHQNEPMVDRLHFAPKGGLGH